MKHCIVGDVHGEYTALLNLVAKTPKGSQLIFVGDLIDRGAQSAYVVRFIRKHGLPCVRGNHEEMMIEYGSKFVEAIENDEPIEQDNVWLKNGGIETLLSYDLISLRGLELVPHVFIKEFIFQFKEDIEWMKQLPLYLELDAAVHESGRSVVVSHCGIAPVWHMRDKEEHEKVFRERAMWSRLEPLDQAPIFNVFGHTPQKYSVDLHAHYVNVDTGCYIKKQEGYGLLSAYCVESGEVYSSGELHYELSA
ncbi:metallophosphoesterase [bacterium]|nr:metallophosphoesterase [bacterium]MBU1956841.1 metallophosphoesterase [bacterium]